MKRNDVKRKPSLYKTIDSDWVHFESIYQYKHLFISIDADSNFVNLLY